MSQLQEQLVLHDWLGRMSACPVSFWLVCTASLPNLVKECCFFPANRKHDSGPWCYAPHWAVRPAWHSPLFLDHTEESSSGSWDTVWYCCQSMNSCTVFMHSFTKATSLLIMHRPKVSINRSTNRGPSNVEIRVVNQGDCWNQDSNHPFEPHILFFCFVNVKPYFYLGKVMILFLIGVRRYGSYKMRS